MGIAIPVADLDLELAIGRNRAFLWKYLLRFADLIFLDIERE